MNALNPSATARRLGSEDFQWNLTKFLDNLADDVVRRYAQDRWGNIESELARTARLSKDSKGKDVAAR